MASIKWKGKLALVTGGTGFIGSFLVERLLSLGAQVRVPVRSDNYRSLSPLREQIQWMEGDLRDPEYCKLLVTGVDHVFHLASCRRNVEFHHDRCSGVLTENVRMTLSLMEGLRDFPHVPVTFFSTANISPKTDILELTKQERLDGYVLGKALCEQMWYVGSREREFPLLIIRPLGVYGPRDTFTAESNVIPALMFKARRKAEMLSVWGTGDQERSFLYVEDLVDATLRLVEAGAEGVQYIHSTELVPVRTVAKTIRDLINPKLTIKYNPEKPRGTRSVPRLQLHTSLKDFPWTPLAEGLAKTADWWKNSMKRNSGAAMRDLERNRDAVAQS
ncbi:NAD(P)-dependent oxidoreductase [Candidatus Peregrinibacteria bacterium]|nr:NAD(P)-dependent oxidoreductase [Candidatus Peregrinibacteria bacterium]